MRDALGKRLAKTERLCYNGAGGLVPPSGLRAKLWAMWRRCLAFPLESRGKGAARLEPERFRRERVCPLQRPFHSGV
jgi:hypothetical protein